MDDIVKMLGYFVIGGILFAILFELIGIMGKVLTTLLGSTFGLILVFVLAVVIIKKVL